MIKTFNRRSRLANHFKWMWQHKDGSCVLKEESRWHKHVRGILINHGNKHTIIMFRGGRID